MKKRLSIFGGLLVLFLLVLSIYDFGYLASTEIKAVNKCEEEYLKKTTKVVFGATLGIYRDKENEGKEELKKAKKQLEKCGKEARSLRLFRTPKFIFKQGSP